MSNKSNNVKIAIKNHADFEVVDYSNADSIEFKTVLNAIEADSDVQLVMDIASDEVETQQGSITVFVDDEQVQSNIITVDTNIPMSDRDLTPIEFEVLNNQLMKLADNLADKIEKAKNVKSEVIWAD